MQHIPPIKRVRGTPIFPARLPASKLPNGVMPRKENVKKLIARPRLSSSTFVCNHVLKRH
jgi:hypothetical protein